LLSECVDDARKMQMHGVAMVTSSKTWLAGSKLLLKNGFERVDQAPPVFELLLNRFDDAPAPRFPKDWDERLGRYGAGLTVIRSDQCPYIEVAVDAVLETAREMGADTQVVELNTCEEVQDRAPSAYGVFHIVHNGQLLTYHWPTRRELAELRAKLSS